MTNPSAGGLKAVNNSGNLKPEDVIALNMEGNKVEKGSNDDCKHDMTINPPLKIRLEYLDGLRGLLCIIVVIHHFRCGFHPCGIFGASAEWLNDPTMCSTNSSTFAFLAPFVNGTFSVAVFFVMSGTVLSNGLSMVDENRWRLAVVKRYFRLMLPCAAATLLAYLLGGITSNQRAGAITGSKWLVEYGIRRPSPLALLDQILFGIWHNSSTLNNSVWTMSIELFGSYLVFGLVMILKGSSPILSKKFLALLFIGLLVPSTTLGTSLTMELEWQRDVENTVKVSVNPISHAHLLQTLGNFNLSLTQQTTQTWWDQEPEPKSIHLDDNNSSANGMLVKELFQPDIPIKFVRQELVRSTKWKKTNPFIWYSAFVAGVWITENNLRQGGPQKLAVWQTALLFFVTYLCASYPFHLGLWVNENYVWRSMKSVAGMLGLGFASSYLYYIIGASCLVQLVVSTPKAKAFLSSSTCRWFGQISFSLYLVHIPILYTQTSHFFVFLYSSGVPINIASFSALLLSFPSMVIVAALFEYYIDRPSLSASSAIGKHLLGMGQ